MVNNTLLNMLFQQPESPTDPLAGLNEPQAPGLNLENLIAEPEALTGRQKALGSIGDLLQNFVNIKYRRPMAESSVARMQNQARQDALAKTRQNFANAQLQMGQEQFDERLAARKTEAAANRVERGKDRQARKEEAEASREFNQAALDQQLASGEDIARMRDSTSRFLAGQRADAAGDLRRLAKFDKADEMFGQLTVATIQDIEELADLGKPLTAKQAAQKRKLAKQMANATFAALPEDIRDVYVARYMAEYTDAMLDVPVEAERSNELSAKEALGLDNAKVPHYLSNLDPLSIISSLLPTPAPFLGRESATRPQNVKADTPSDVDEWKRRLIQGQ